MNRKALIFIFPLFLVFLAYSLPLVVGVEEKGDVQVGLGYNVWMYNWEDDPNCVDVPFLGYYNSDDPIVLRSHVYWFNDLGLDFVMVTWQGRYYNPYVDQNCKLFFEVVKNYSKRVKACIIVEKTGNETNEAEIYDYIYEEFVMKYPTVYYYYKGKPLIIFFSVDSTIFSYPDDPLQYDSRFTVIKMGVYASDEWLYQNIYYPGKDGNASDKTWQGESPRCRHIPVIPRYDDRFITSPPRNSTYYVDPELTWLYDAEWEKAIEAVENGEVEVITISWWNEYAERTNIEPHYDYTALDKDPFLLYNKTKHYIQVVKGLVEAEPEPWFYNPQKFVFVVIMGVACCSLAIYISKRW